MLRGSFAAARLASLLGGDDAVEVGDGVGDGLLGRSGEGEQRTPLLVALEVLIAVCLLQEAIEIVACLGVGIYEFARFVGQHAGLLELNPVHVYVEQDVACRLLQPLEFLQVAGAELLGVDFAEGQFVKGTFLDDRGVGVFAPKLEQFLLDGVNIADLHLTTAVLRRIHLAVIAGDVVLLRQLVRELLEVFGRLPRLDSASKRVVFLEVGERLVKRLFNIGVAIVFVCDGVYQAFRRVVEVVNRASLLAERALHGLVEVLAKLGVGSQIGRLWLVGGAGGLEVGSPLSYCRL